MEVEEESGPLIRLDAEIKLLFHIKKIEKSETHILTGVFINKLDREIAIKFKKFVEIYEKEKNIKERVVDDFEKIVVIIGTPTLLIAILISFLMARGIVKPIEKLISGTKEIAKGNLNYKIKEIDKGELGELIKSFNYMSNELLRNKNQLYRIEKIAAWREVARRLAHEIKNPLTPIKLANERIFRQYHLKNEKFENILATCSNIIISEVERLGNLVNEFSEFARLPQIKLAQVDIIDLINEIVTIYKTTSPVNHYEIQVNIANELRNLYADEEKIKQVLINLIDNSIESKNEQLNITIVVNKITIEEKRFCQIIVIDNAKGIEQEDILYIFEPHYSTKKRGSGLGLSIVKNIIEEHNGNIYIKSIKSEGTSFFIEIPY